MDVRPALRSSVALAAALALAACGPTDDASDASDAAATSEQPIADRAAAGADAGADVSRPDTTAEAVWAYLEAQDYQSWPMWPGTAALYEGTEPHGMLLTTYVNELASNALEAGDAAGVPDGGIVVKENYMPDSTLAAVTVMYRVAGYDAEHADWWFLKRVADGTVEASGRVESCQNCHENMGGGDFLVTSLPGGDGGMGEGAGG